MPTLNWIGKEAVVNHHLQVPFHLLKDVPDLACGDPGSGNLIVEGDNLVALKALLPYYAGQVKCIYIDPPYNTGEEEWVYNDNVNSPLIREWLGRVVGKEAEDLSRHEKWLCMMYPRLLLLKKFLNNDGSIWVSIDDAEVAALRMLMDEIFGRDRFVASNVWQKRYSRENREAIGDVHEYIVVYAMNPKRFKEVRNRIPITGKQAKVYKNPNDDPKGRWRPIPITAQAGHATPDQFYSITAPSGKVFKPSEGRCWGLAEATFNQMRAEGKIWFGKKGNSQPNLIRYLSEVEGMVPWTWWPHDDVGHTDESKKEIYEILGKEVDFATPKPVRLLERILQIATNPGDLVLDSFAGSGTTAHAVLKLNHQAAREKTRRFLLIQMPFESEKQQKSEDNIAREITRERARRVAEGYTNAKGENAAGLGGGFRYCEMGEPLFDEGGRIRKAVRFADLARHVYFTETGEPLPRERVGKSPLLGITSTGVAVYLLYNGILQDKSVDGGNVLTGAALALLPPHSGPRVVYAAGCRFSPERRKQENIVFKQTPYAIRVQ
ncbi:MAG: site-specific DNA-methyltransferase [Verrucomicrobia bacterium]|nr:site-specific DNA-methyltransferase [Verrucomicrobiota bacterium]